MTKASNKNGALPPISLAPENTPQGAMERLFLDEAPPPGKNYDTNLDLQSMRDMRQAIENRRKNPSEYEARGATNEIQIITVHNQFQGFGDYPKGIPPHAADDVKTANDPAHPLRAEYHQHVQNAITAATESITPPVAGLPNATAWYATGQGHPVGDFYSLGDVDKNTFYGTGPGPGNSKTPVEKARHHGAQTRAQAANKPMAASDKILNMLLRLSPQLPSIAPIPGQAGQRKNAGPQRAGGNDAAGLPALSRMPGLAVTPAMGATSEQEAAATGFGKIIADANAKAAQTKAQREASRAAMGLPPQSLDLSSRSFAPTPLKDAAGNAARTGAPGMNSPDQQTARAAGQDNETIPPAAAGQLSPYVTANALSPRQQPTPGGNAHSFLHELEHGLSYLSPFALEKAIENYFYRLTRLPPNGGAAVNPHVSPIFAGQKLPG